MRPAEKRVAIAKDVLAILDAGRYVPRVGEYVDYPRLIQEVRAREVAGEPRCTVCALGATVISACRLGTFEAPAFGNLEETAVSIRKSLSGIFEAEELDLMEAAFEQSSALRWFVARRELTKEAAAWGERFDDQEDLFRAVFENILACNGNFTPKGNALPRPAETGASHGPTRWVQDA